MEAATEQPIVATPAATVAATVPAATVPAMKPDDASAVAAGVVEPSRSW